MTYDNHIRIFRGRDQAWIPELPEDFRFIPKKNSDVIMVRFVSALTNHLISLYDQYLVVALNPEFQAGDCIAVFNEKGAVFTQVMSRSFEAGKQYLSLPQSIEEQFRGDTEVGKLKMFTFFIEETDRNNQSGEKIFALYLLDDHIKVELVPNVVNLKARCFKKINSQLTAADRCTGKYWSDVIAVQIDLLLRSENIVFDTPKEYWFDGNQAHSRYLYQTFHLVIPLLEHS
jgi:hypothetical protein